MCNTSLFRYHKINNNFHLSLLQNQFFYWNYQKYRNSDFLFFELSGFISKKIKSGRFHSASEVIRAGLRLLELEEKKMEELRSALEKGEQSGIAKDFNSKGHLKSLHLKNEEIQIFK